MIPVKDHRINIRNNLRSFFVDEIIANTPNIVSNKSQPVNCLLVLDDRTSAILNKLMGVIDLIEAGILGVELLKIPRKRFPDHHVVYFVDPTEEAIDIIKSDFTNSKLKDEQGNPIKGDNQLYNYVHFVFISPISPRLLASLISDTKVVLAMLSIRQINMDIMTIDENLFSLDFEKEDRLFNTLFLKNEGKVLEEMADKALSIFTLIKKVEAVQIVFEEDELSKAFVDKFRPKVQELIEGINQVRENNESYPPVFMIVVNRGSDVVTPFLSDSTYASMYFNMLEQSKPVLEFEMVVDAKDGIVDNVTPLNDSDPLWTAYKYRSFKEAKKQTDSMFSELEKNSLINSDKSNSKVNPDALAEALRNMPQLEEKVKDLQKHSNTMARIDLKQAEVNFDQLFQIEQGIASGKKKDGSPFSISKELDTSVVKSEEDLMRLALLLYFAQNRDNDFCLSLLPEESVYRAQFKLLSSTFSRIRTTNNSKLSSDGFINSNSEKYCHSKAYDFVRSFLKMDFEEFEESDQFKSIKLHPSKVSLRPFERNWFKPSDGFQFKVALPVVVVFFLGGVCYSESAELNSLPENKVYGDFKLIVGGTNVYSQYSIMEKYLEIGRAKKENNEKEQEANRAADKPNARDLFADKTTKVPLLKE